MTIFTSFRSAKAVATMPKVTLLGKLKRMAKSLFTSLQSFDSMSNKYFTLDTRNQAIRTFSACFLILLVRKSCSSQEITEEFLKPHLRLQFALSSSAISQREAFIKIVSTALPPQGTLFSWTSSQYALEMPFSYNGYVLPYVISFWQFRTGLKKKFKTFHSWSIHNFWSFSFL